MIMPSAYCPPPAYLLLAVKCKVFVKISSELSNLSLSMFVCVCVGGGGRVEVVPQFV